MVRRTEICPPRSTARITGIMRTKRRSNYKRRCCTPPTFDAARSDARFGRSAEAGSTNPQLSSPRASAGMCGGIRAHVEMELVRKTGIVTYATKVRLEAEAYLPGTDGSNPFPSSGESTNFRFLSRRRLKRPGSDRSVVIAGVAERQRGVPDGGVLIAVGASERIESNGGVAGASGVALERQ